MPVRSKDHLHARLQICLRILFVVPVFLEIHCLHVIILQACFVNYLIIICFYALVSESPGRRDPVAEAPIAKIFSYRDQIVAKPTSAEPPAEETPQSLRPLFVDEQHRRIDFQTLPVTDRGSLN